MILLLLACAGRPFLDAGPCLDTFDGPAIAECEVPGWDDRAYDLVLPAQYDGVTPVPVLLALHGGGGNKQAAARTTCASGEVDDPSCLHRHAQDNGYAVIFPNGTGFGLTPEVRTWNAGGGEGGWRCVSGKACDEGIDDVAYIEELLDDVEARVAVDPTRVYATGLSNGGAMSHRLACELSDRIAAIAPVGGANQLAAAGECAPARPVPVLHVHGTADPCWQYEEGPPDCPVGGGDAPHVGVEQTMEQWAEVLGCDAAPSEVALPDTARDGTSSVRLTWSGCDAPLEHLRVDGGGHAWPDGYQYLRERVIGPVPRDWGNEVIWDFLSTQRLEDPPG